MPPKPSQVSKPGLKVKWFLSRWINPSPLLLLNLNLHFSRYRLLIAASAPFRETHFLSTILSSHMWLFSVWCVNAPAGLCLLVFFLSPPLTLWLHSQSAPSCAVSVCEAAGLLQSSQVTDCWDISYDNIPCTGKYIKFGWRWFKGIKTLGFPPISAASLTFRYALTDFCFLLWKTIRRCSVGRAVDLLLVTSLESCEDAGKSKPGLVLSHRHSVVCLLFAILFLQFKERKKALGALFSHLLMTFSSHSQFIFHSLPSSSSSCCTLVSLPTF